MGLFLRVLGPRPDAQMNRSGTEWFRWAVREAVGFCAEGRLSHPPESAAGAFDSKGAGAIHPLNWAWGRTQSVPPFAGPTL